MSRCERCDSADLRILPVDDREGWPVYCATCGWLGRVSDDQFEALT